MIENDLQYYCRRREQELAMAEAARSPEAASAHGVLALFYAEKVRRLRTRQRQLTVVSATPRLARAG